MAAYNEITLPAWQNLVRRMFGLQGPGGAVPNLSPEIQAVAVVQKLSPEFRRLKGEALWAAGLSNSSTAAGAAVVGLVNPAGSGIVAIVERLTWRMSSSIAGVIGNVRLDTQANIEGNTEGGVFTVNAGPRDTRFITPGAGIPGVVLRRGPHVGAFNVGFTIATELQQTGSIIGWNRLHDLVIWPGFGFSVEVNQVGVGSNIIVNLEWYERVALPEELTA